jgi:hypothetical protein
LRWPWALLVALGCWLLADAAGAHPIRSGYLEVTRAAADDYRVRFTLPTPDGIPSEVEIVFDARCAVSEPLVADTALQLDRA